MNNLTAAGRKILKDLLDEFEIQNGTRIDFRKHVYVDNSYGCYPSYRYDLAKDIVIFAHNFLENYIEENKESYPLFGGWVYNTEMEIDKLRWGRLKIYLEDMISGMMSYENYSEAK